MAAVETDTPRKPVSPPLCVCLQRFLGNVDFDGCPPKQAAFLHVK